MSINTEAQTQDRFYYPLKSRGGQYVDALADFGDALPSVESLDNYIRMHFDRHTALVCIGENDYTTDVYSPRDVLDFHFAITDAEGIPQGSGIRLGIKDKAILTYCSRLAELLMVSEWILPEQQSHLKHEFTLPRLKEIPEWEEDQGEAAPFAAWRRLRASTHSVVLGAAGSGKTSLARRLVLDILDENLRKEVSRIIPIYIELRTWKAGDDVYRRLQHAMAKEGSDWLAERLKPLGDAGYLFFVFDGLDEVRAENRASAAAGITKVVHDFPKAKVLISTRPGEYAFQFSEFTHFSVEPLSDAQQRELVLLKLGTRGAANTFLCRLNEEQSMKDLVRNPLALSLSLARYKRGETNPHYASEVVSDIVSIFVDDWDSRRGIVRSDKEWASPARRTVILMRLGNYLARTRRERFTTAEFLECNRGVAGLELGPDALAGLEEHTGLVRRVGTDTWSFAHRVLLEYFASSYFVNSVRDSEEDIVGLGTSALWRRVWRFTCGLTSDATELIRRLLTLSEKKRFFRSAVLFDVLSERVYAEEGVVRSGVELLIEELVAVLEGAEAGLMKGGQEDARDEVWAVSFECNQSRVATRVLPGFLRGLYRLRDGIAEEILVEQLRDSKDERVRCLAGMLEMDGLWSDDIQRVEKKSIVVAEVRAGL